MKKAREEGKLVRSQLLTQLPCVIFILILATRGFGWTMVRSKILLDYAKLNEAYDPATLLANSLQGLLSFIVSYFILIAGFCTLADISQIGFAFAPAVVSFKWDRLSVGQGLKRTIGGAKRAVPLLAKLLLVTVLFSFLLSGYLRSISTLTFEAASLDLSGMHEELLIFGRWIVAALGITGAAEFLFRRRKHLRDLSMTHDELRREHRQDEGDPMLRSQRKAMHESLLMQDLIQRVRRSKVIVVERM